MINGKNPWEHLESDREKEILGVWHDYPGADGWRFRIARLCQWNEAFYRGFARLALHPRFSDVYRRCLDGDETPSDEDELLIHELECMKFIEGCVRDGEFVGRDGEQKSGKDVNAVLELFLACPPVYHWARQRALAVEHFEPDKQAIAKNSETVSSTSSADGTESAKPS